MIKYNIVQEADITKDFLNGYKRYYHTTKMLSLQDGKLVEIETDFVDDWDVARLEEISLYLKDCIKSGGKVVAAFDGVRVIAFGNIESKLYDNYYINMPFIHVTAKYRNKGIGNTLFSMLEEEARKLGGTALYISTHPDVSAQKFYDSVGTTLAKTLIKELYDKEPADIQREKILKTKI